MAKVIGEFLTEHDPLGEFGAEEVAEQSTEDDIGGVAETA